MDKFLIPHMFCECGTIIYVPTIVNEEITCKRCSRTIKSINSEVIVTEIAFKTTEQHDGAKVSGAKIKMKCPKCGAEEVSYNSAQLRSADEGQTVFYSCDECDWKETVNS